MAAKIVANCGLSRDSRVVGKPNPETPQSGFQSARWTQQAMTEIRQATPLEFPDSDELRFLPEGPLPLEDGVISWVAIQHGPDATHGSLNILNLKSGENRSFELPGRPGFAFPCRL